MDPFSQGITGAVAAQSIGKPLGASTGSNASRSGQLAALFVGAVAGMAADLDVLIRSPSDPLLFLEYHRQFTHSLIFIPIGGMLCALFLYAVVGRRRQWSFASTWLLSSVAYATHGLLDSCTTYGTLLLWPFSDTRFAWNNVSIIDPLYTLPLFALSVLAWRKRNALFARLAVLWAVFYLAVGLVQHERAQAVGWKIAKERGHQPLRLEAKPSFANVVLWKIVYQTQERFYVDAVRVMGKAKVFEGDSTPILSVARDFPWLDETTQQRKDIERFRWFSNDYLAPDPDNPLRIVDVRYSLLPNSVKALWGIELRKDAQPHEHVSYETSRERDGSEVTLLRNMIFD